MQFGGHDGEGNGSGGGETGEGGRGFRRGRRRERGGGRGGRGQIMGFRTVCFVFGPLTCALTLLRWGPPWGRDER